MGFTLPRAVGLRRCKSHRDQTESYNKLVLWPVTLIPALDTQASYVTLPTSRVMEEELHAVLKTHSRSF